MSEGTVYVDARFKNEAGQILVVGRVKIGHRSTITPRDLGMKRIKSISFSPWSFTTGALSLNSMGSARRFGIMEGSIGSIDTDYTGSSVTSLLGNYVRVKAYVVAPAGSIGANPSHAGGVRVYIGTVAGSMRASYTAVGV